MKLLYTLTVFAFLLVSFPGFGQVANDDCSSAIFLGTLSTGNATGTCIDGTNGYDTSMASISNAGATANFPYYSMTGCNGYASSTANPAKDIWYKFIAGSFTIKVFSPDTVHMNVWNGSCDSLLAAGCHTLYDTVMSSFEETFCGMSSAGDTAYLQFSGASAASEVTFSFCLKGEGGNCVSYGVPVINNGSADSTENTGAANRNNSFLPAAKIYPNPANEEITVYLEHLSGSYTVSIQSIFGQEMKRIRSGGNRASIDIRDLAAGVYFVVVTGDGNWQVEKKIVKR